MKMLVVSLFLISALLTSCNTQNENDMRNADTSISIQDVPDSIEGWGENEIYKLKSQIERIPLDSCEEYFTDEVRGFLNQYENAELGDLTIRPDNLSVIKGKNKKSLYNLNFEVNVVMDINTDDFAGSYELAEEIPRQLEDFLYEHTYYGLKVKALDINILDRNYTRFHNVSSTYTVMEETVFAEQPEDEYAVQTFAFHFSETNPDFILQKFGVIPETSELYAEYYVDEGYFDYSNMESSIADLETVSTNIKEYLTSQKETEEYVSSNGLKLLTISFQNGNFEDSYLTFNFEL